LLPFILDEPLPLNMTRVYTLVEALNWIKGTNPAKGGLIDGVTILPCVCSFAAVMSVMSTDTVPYLPFDMSSHEGPDNNEITEIAEDGFTPASYESEVRRETAQPVFGNPLRGWE
jgi:hypothetical protein